MLQPVSSRVSGFPLVSPCVWGKLQSLSFLKVSKQVVMPFCVAGTQLPDIHVSANVSKIVLCGTRNTIATFSEDELHFSCQARHFGDLHRHFAWHAQHYSDSALLKTIQAITEVLQQRLDPPSSSAVNRDLFTCGFWWDNWKSTQWGL